MRVHTCGGGQLAATRRGPQEWLPAQTGTSERAHLSRLSRPIQTPSLPTPAPQAPKAPHTFRSCPFATLSVPGGAAWIMGKGGYVAADRSETGQNLW